MPIIIAPSSIGRVTIKKLKLCVQELRTANDSELTQEIARELQRQRSLGNLKEFRIRVSVENGIAVLDGRSAVAPLVCRVAGSTSVGSGTM
jgi:hypothetical protein